jgi:hypothetical protein
VPAVPPGDAASSIILGFLTPSLISTTPKSALAGLEHVVSIVGIDEVELDRGYSVRPKP